MTDLQITQRCAAAMGLNIDPEPFRCKVYITLPNNMVLPYDPLHNDAQAMALLKRFPDLVLDELTCYRRYPRGVNPGSGFNRVICEAVARMQAK